MLGRNTLWLPGCDHAGIATQSIIEKLLWRRERKTKHDLGREEFTSLAQKWKDKYQESIRATTRRLGASVDWSRERFTMDEDYRSAVKEAFIRLHQHGLIHRSNRLVNWSTSLKTAISNLEVVDKELSGRTFLNVPGYERKIEFGVLTYFAYPVAESHETIEIATTRPETMLGDTGIAVHPSDNRHSHLIGKFAKHPFVDRLMPIIGDDAVDMEFGTGAVKITPAHDFNDFEFGQKHGLDVINILNDEGTLNKNAGEFAGMKRFDARKEVVKRLIAIGLYVKWENNSMSIPICDRSQDVVEPLLRPQWYLRIDSLAEDAARVVNEGSIRILPESAKHSFSRWMNDRRDWCLSRQLWWGHQIPAYFVHLDGEVPTADDTREERWIVAMSHDAADRIAKQRFQGKTYTLQQDHDVLDTWFSSGLWPFATLGWPNGTEDFITYYPHSILETGRDILFFWVARMMMLGINLTGQAPFKEVYCHALIRDHEGRKMSKSLGNVIDPLDVVDGISLSELHEKLDQGNLDPKELGAAIRQQEKLFPRGIPGSGTDALRLSLLSWTTGCKYVPICCFVFWSIYCLLHAINTRPGDDIKIDMKRIDENRRFCNKIFQATRYVLMTIGDDYLPSSEHKHVGRTIGEQWVLHRFNEAVRDMNDALQNREFSRATAIAYHFWQLQFCDVFIENSKALLDDESETIRRSVKDTLYVILEGGLRLLHPIIPFLTEDLWQRLPQRTNCNFPSIILTRYPTQNPFYENEEAATSYERLIDAAKAIRNLLGQFALNASSEPIVYIQSKEKKDYEMFSKNISSIQILSQIPGIARSNIQLLTSTEIVPRACLPHNISSSDTVYLAIESSVDLNKEIEKLSGKVESLQASLLKQRNLLCNMHFLTRTSEIDLANKKAKADELEGLVRQTQESILQLRRVQSEMY